MCKCVRRRPRHATSTYERGSVFSEDKVERAICTIIHIFICTTKKPGPSHLSHRHVHWDHFHWYWREVLVKGWAEQINTPSRLCSSPRQNYTLLERITSDNSHQLIAWKLPLCYHKTKICIRGNSLPALLLSMFKHLNLPLLSLLFCLLVWKKLHLPSCHRAVSGEKGMWLLRCQNRRFM